MRARRVSRPALVDVKVAAIDEDWSGLKFMYRLARTVPLHRLAARSRNRLRSPGRGVALE